MFSHFWNSCSLLYHVFFPISSSLIWWGLSVSLKLMPEWRDGLWLSEAAVIYDFGGCKDSHRCSKRKETCFCLCFSPAHAILQSRGKLDSWTLPLELLCVSILVSLYICRGKNKILKGFYCYCFVYKKTQQESMKYLDGISWYKNIWF